MKQKLGPKQKNWIKALRSGRFKQGQEHLRSTKDEFCCLGVRCHQARKRLGLKVEKEDDKYGYNKETAGLPEKVREDLKMIGSLGCFTDKQPHRIGKHKKYALAFHNDSGATFLQIADFIEKNPELVFTGPA